MALYASCVDRKRGNTASAIDTAAPFGLLDLAAVVARRRLHALCDTVEEQLGIGRRSHGADTDTGLGADIGSSPRGRWQLQDTSDGREWQRRPAWFSGPESLKPVCSIPVGVRLGEACYVEVAEVTADVRPRLGPPRRLTEVILLGRPMSCVPGYFEVINTHTVGFLTIPTASIKWV